MKLYPFILFLSFLFSLTIVGQVPPYQHAVTTVDGSLVRNILFFRSMDNAVDITPHFNKDAFLCDIREEIPFYTLLTYPSVDDYYLEYYFKAFNYRHFESFTAPKGVRKMTYYLGNNLIDSVEVAQHTFWFNKKTHLLEKEIKDQKNMKSSFSRDLVDREIYLYKYEEYEEEYIIKKFLKLGKEEKLLEKFTYSKDKIRLLKTEFYQWDKIKELLNYTYNKEPTFHQAFFCYSTENELEYAFFDGKIITDGSYSNRENDYREELDNREKWNKLYWIEQFNITEQNSEKIKFPVIDDFESEVKNIRFINSFDRTDGRGSYEFKQNGFLWRTSNIFDFDYYETFTYNYTDAGESHLTYLLLLFDERNKFNIGMIRRRSYFQKNERSDTFSPISKILISSYIDDENKYLVKRIDSSDRRGGIEYSETYSIQLKPTKGLQEVYLIHNTKKLPLLTIN